MNIVGNNYNYNDNEHDHMNIIYLGYNQSMALPTEKQLREELSKYADVKFVYYKKAPE